MKISRNYQSFIFNFYFFQFSEFAGIRYFTTLPLTGFSRCTSLFNSIKLGSPVTFFVTFSRSKEDTVNMVFMSEKFDFCQNIFDKNSVMMKN